MASGKLITETVERRCCDQQKDLVRIGLGEPTIIGRQFFFCKHCGQQWENQGGSEPDSPGLQPLPWPWELESKYGIKIPKTAAQR